MGKIINKARHAISFNSSSTFHLKDQTALSAAIKCIISEVLKRDKASHLGKGFLKRSGARLSHWVCMEDEGSRWWAPETIDLILNFEETQTKSTAAEFCFLTIYNRQKKPADDTIHNTTTKIMTSFKRNFSAKVTRPTKATSTSRKR